MAYDDEARAYDSGKVDLLMAAVVHLFRQRPNGAREFADFANRYVDAAVGMGFVPGQSPALLSAGEAISGMQADIENPGQFDSHLPSAPA